MKQDLLAKIEIPEGVEVEMKESMLIIKSGERKLERKFNPENILIKKKDGNIILESKKATKRESKMLHTIKAHINNMISGVQEDFEYTLEIAHSHFPMNVNIDESKNKMIIKNFIGEKKERNVNLIEGASVEVKGNLITVKSPDKEIAGQTAANIEKATHIRKKDRRKFQDGIYIIQKGRKKNEN